MSPAHITLGKQSGPAPVSPAGVLVDMPSFRMLLLAHILYIQVHLRVIYIGFIVLKPVHMLNSLDFLRGEGVRDGVLSG